MENLALWIEDLLGNVKENNNPESIKIIKNCGRGCALRAGTIDTMKKMR